ncbi:hypothetical protein GCM10022247_71180 [Allokutzneria multivorans]|uniref:Uncharacterized protein n=1 Tax=Allokutzneria multivorans TaxID=1142134 RepID=A0ABP7U3U6_9PSEU
MLIEPLLADSAAPSSAAVRSTGSQISRNARMRPAISGMPSCASNRAANDSIQSDGCRPPTRLVSDTARPQLQ